jgi:hypothetical protein
MLDEFIMEQLVAYKPTKSVFHVDLSRIENFSSLFRKVLDSGFQSMYLLRVFDFKI